MFSPEAYATPVPVGSEQPPGSSPVMLPKSRQTVPQGGSWGTGEQKGTGAFAQTHLWQHLRSSCFPPSQQLILSFPGHLDEALGRAQSARPCTEFPGTCSQPTRNCGISGPKSCVLAQPHFACTLEKEGGWGWGEGGGWSRLSPGSIFPLTWLFITLGTSLSASDSQFLH